MGGNTWFFNCNFISNVDWLWLSHPQHRTLRVVDAVCLMSLYLLREDQWDLLWSIVTVAYLIEASVMPRGLAQRVITIKAYSNKISNFDELFMFNFITFLFPNV